MRRGHPHICLFQPEIPQNTGNIARLCAATQSRLHLIEPLGFDASDRQLRRAGLDYWPFLDLEIHRSFSHFQRRCPVRLAFLSKKAERSYKEIPLDVQGLVFGRETTGLPAELWQDFEEDFFQIPIYHEGVRSLNLANAVAIVAYELLTRSGPKT